VTVRTDATGTASGSADDTVVTDVSVRSARITTDEPAVITVTVRNPQPTVDTHLVELELFGQVINRREVTVPGGGAATVQFTYDIVAPGNYTARVDSETATIRVRAPGRATASLTATPTPATSTEFPGFGPVSVVVSLVLATLLFVRRP
jgi:PGF-CTERM protein